MHNNCRSTSAEGPFPGPIKVPNNNKNNTNSNSNANEQTMLFNGVDPAFSFLCFHICSFICFCVWLTYIKIHFTDEKSDLECLNDFPRVRELIHSSACGFKLSVFYHQVYLMSST